MVRTRARRGAPVELPAGSYSAEIVLTEESFHADEPGGGEYHEAAAEANIWHMACHWGASNAILASVCAPARHQPFFS